MKKKKIKLILNENKNGFSIWLNKNWIIDASLILEDYTIDIDLKKMKVIFESKDMISFTLKKT